MSEMVERVSAAIRRVNEETSGLKYSDLTAEMARSAIEAMRRPTPGMYAAAWTAFRGNRTGRILSEGPAFREAMGAMISAALSDSGDRDA